MWCYVSRTDRVLQMNVALAKFSVIYILVGLGLLLRLGVAAWNGFWGPSFGAGPDAAGFHLGAMAYAADDPIVGDFSLTNVYMYSLGTVYRWVSPSLFLGSALSCLAWLASAILLLRMMKVLSLDDGQQFKAMLIFAFLPSAVVITSVTLREVYQLLAVHLVVHSALQIYLAKSFRHWFFLLAGVAFMGVLHGALLVAGLAIAVITALFTFFDKADPYSLAKLGLAAFLLALVAYAGAPLFIELLFNLKSGLGEAMQARQDSWQQSARASYSTMIKIRSDADLLLFVPVAVFQYLFQPFPWRVSTVLDWALMLENLLRLFLLCKATALYFGPHQHKARVAFVFLAYLVIETIWAVGTINWGTAVRHHVPASGLLLLASFAWQKKFK